MHEEELRTDFQDPPKAYPMRLQSMFDLIIDGFSDDELVRWYNDLEDKESWEEVCRRCRVNRLLHKNGCIELDVEKVKEEGYEFASRYLPQIDVPLNGDSH